jgi:hypothetical protein
MIIIPIFNPRREIARELLSPDPAPSESVDIFLKDDAIKLA